MTAGIPTHHCLAGTVIKTAGDRATVEVAPDSCSGCGTRNSCGLIETAVPGVIVDVHNRIDARVGDRVTVKYSARSQVLSACILYVTPSISTLLGVAVGQTVLAGCFGLSPLTAGLLGALIFCALGFVPAVVVSRVAKAGPTIGELETERLGGSS